MKWQPYPPGINLAWSWCIIFSVHCWIWSSFLRCTFPDCSLRASDSAGLGWGRLWLLQPLTLCLSVPPAFDNPYALVVLAEEELVVIDLQTAGWPPIQPPYLASLHCSAITCSHHVSNIPLKLWERIVAAGNQQQTHFSTMVGPAPALPHLGPSSPMDFLVSFFRSGPLMVVPVWPQPLPRGTCCSQGRRLSQHSPSAE